METSEEVVVRKSALTKDGHRRFLLKVIALAFIISLFGGAGAALASYLTLKNAAEDGTELAQQINDACDSPGIKDPDPDLAQFCLKAEAVVDSAPATVLTEPTPGAPGESGVDGLNGLEGIPGPAPSSEQVLTAVRRFCTTTGQCRGADGSDATPAQVAISIASYCNNRGECQGADGVDGVDADPVTQTQLIEAVNSYCAEGNCRGPAGVDGADSNVPGPQGPPGVTNVNDNCNAAPEGQVIDNVDAFYDSENRTINVTCTYKTVQPGPPA